MNGVEKAPRSDPGPASASRPVCLMVLGMHRSGTSAVAGCLQIVGVPLGGPLIAADFANENGYFEHAEVVAIDEQLLESLGASALTVDLLPDDWLQRPETAVARERIETLLRRDFAWCPWWAVKDPRLCLLYPLWLEALQRVGVEPRFLLVHRDPFAVARSLERRDGLEQGASLALWLRHTRGALEAAELGKHAAVSYEDLLVSPAATLATAFDALGLQPPRLFERDVAAELSRFLGGAGQRANASRSPEVSPEVAASFSRFARVLRGKADGRGSDSAAEGRLALGDCLAKLESLEGGRRPEGSVEDSFALRWIGATVAPIQQPGELSLVEATLAYSGERPLSARQLKLSYHWARADEPTEVVVWEGLRALVLRAFLPGDTRRVWVPVLAPPFPGSYVLRLDVVRELVTWFSLRGMATWDTAVTVADPDSVRGHGRRR